ncbi:MAG: hypothetical protein WHS43_06940 [Aquificaceae bacterium]|jgi:hypothetical protein|uniref:hypothetical protein n=1 Tax=Hydrogenobacter TaxID=939 RepID=UPI001C741950|nr:hypothetical protein [Hydrogenobacter thermophilus]QWK20454.1 MAG: hypothetical protein KNN13_03810 [Hydrogenobacter thermophilus]
MISVQEVREFLKQADISEELIQKAINRAYGRFVKLTNSAPDPQKEEHRQALIYLAVLELAPHINLYYRGQGNTEIVRTKELAGEVERLLNITPKGAMVWKEI